jgi:hypothetical protein
MLPQHCCSKNSIEPSRIDAMSAAMPYDDIQQHFETHRAFFERSDELKQRCGEIARFLQSREWHEFWTPMNDALQSDATGLFGWTQQRIGHKPNSILKEHLTDKGLGEKSPAEIWELVDYHGGLRTVRVRAAETLERIERVREGIRRFASLNEALKVLRGSGEGSEQVLLREIEEAVCSPQLSALSDKDLVRYITNDIRRRGRERYEQCQMEGTLIITPPDNPCWSTDSFEEQVFLREFAREDERRWSEMKRRAGITPSEEIVLEHDLSNLRNEGKRNTVKVAKDIGLEVGTVKSLRSRYRRKLRRVI